METEWEDISSAQQRTEDIASLSLSEKCTRA